jgi:hypothetical protein
MTPTHYEIAIRSSLDPIQIRAADIAFRGKGEQSSGSTAEKKPAR